MSHYKLTYHIVWSTKYRRPTISEEHEKKLYAYIHGICKKKNCFLHRINSMPDHIHLCVEINPTISISSFIKLLKQESSKWMNLHVDWFPSFIGWGKGYAAFTVSPNARKSIISYIERQKQHHQTNTFYQEYIACVEKMGISITDVPLFFD